jgi:glycosyltransferase involved in cell wall biosynthesis
MRILHMYGGDQNHFGGIQSLLLTSANCNDSSLESVFAFRFNGPVAERLRTAGSIVHFVANARLRRPLTVRKERRRFAALLERDKIDAVVVHNTSAWLWVMLAPAARRANIPLGLWLHDPSDGRHWLERWAKLTRPDFLLFDSAPMQSLLSPAYPGVPSFVVHPPVERPPNLSEHRLATRLELGVSSDTVVIVQVGRTVPHKGQALHLEALGRLRNLAGWQCLQVGSPSFAHERDYLGFLKRATNVLGIAERVRFVDHWPDLPRLYAAADIYCQPNTGLEPFGLTFVEALYAGLPCIATAGSGGPELILNNACGVVVSANAEALAEALSRLILDEGLRQRLGAAGLRRAAELCSPEVHLKRMHAVFAQITKEFAPRMTE